MEERKIEELVNDITNFVNSASDFDSAVFISKMRREHRTLQQSFTRLVLLWVEYVASNEYQYDLRNKASHEACKRLLEGHPDITSLPLI